MNDSQFQTMMARINDNHREVREDFRKIFDRLAADDRRRAEQGILPRVLRLEKTSDGLLGRVVAVAGIVAGGMGAAWQLASRVFTGGE